MNGAATLLRVVFWLALILWIGALISGGVAATAVFAILPDLGVQVERFDQYPTDEHGRLAAGIIMEPVFTGIDVAQVALGAIVLIAFIAELVMTKRRRWSTSNVLRALALAVAAGTLAWRMTQIMPEMNRELVAYRTAAEAGDVTGAETHRVVFDEAHPMAARFMEATLISLLIVAGASAARKNPAEPEQTDTLEPPQLLNRRPA